VRVVILTLHHTPFDSTTVRFSSPVTRVLILEYRERILRYKITLVSRERGFPTDIPPHDVICLTSFKIGTYQGRKDERERANQWGELGWTACSGTFTLADRRVKCPGDEVHVLFFRSMVRQRKGRKNYASARRLRRVVDRETTY
jgi:hypothetical protein